MGTLTVCEGNERNSWEGGTANTCTFVGEGTSIHPSHHTGIALGISAPSEREGMEIWGTENVGGYGMILSLGTSAGHGYVSRCSAPLLVGSSQGRRLVRYRQRFGRISVSPHPHQSGRPWEQPWSCPKTCHDVSGYVCCFSCRPSHWISQASFQENCPVMHVDASSSSSHAVTKSLCHFYASFSSPSHLHDLCSFCRTSLSSHLPPSCYWQ